MAVELPRRPYLRIKMVSIGDMSVGKSCLIKRYCESKFVSRYIPTIGVDYGVRNVAISTRSNQPVTANVNFWDLSGDPAVSEIGQSFLNDAQCVLAVYDVGDKSTFDHLEDWIKELTSRGAKPLAVCVAANKIDECIPQGPRPRQVSAAEGAAWAQARGYTHVETSCRTGDGVAQLFSHALSESASIMHDNMRDSYET